MSEFKNLNLNQDCIETAIQSLDYVNGVKRKSTNQYEIDCDRKVVLLNIWKKGDGTTTLSNKVGKHHDLGLKIIQDIIKQCLYCDKKDIKHSIKKIKSDDFNLIIQFLQEELEGAIIKSTQVSNGIQYAITSKYKDTFYLTCFNNNTLLLQGKPLAVYTKIYEILSVLIEVDSIIELNSAVYKVDINKDDVYRTMELEMLPTVYHKLCDTTKKIMMSSFVFKSINIDLDDYSPFVEGAIKGLEAFIKLILKQNNYTIPQKKTLGCIFDDSGAIKSDIQISLKAPETVTVLKNCYSFYIAQRHSLAHVDNEPSMSRIIRTKQEADRILETICKIIEEGTNEI